MPQKRQHKFQSYPFSKAEVERRIQNLIELGYIERASDVPAGAIPATTTVPAHAYYGLRVPFYAEETYRCRDCGKEVVWTALEKYQYYEVEQGNMHARRVRCDACYQMKAKTARNKAGAKDRADNGVLME